MKKYTYLLLILIGLIFLFIPRFSFASQQQVYLLKLKYEQGVVINESVLVKSMFFQEEKNQPEKGYLLELVSFDKQKLYSLKFDFPLLILSEPPAEWFDKNGRQIYFPKKGEGTKTFLDKAGIELIVPYFKNGQTINIYDPDNKKVLAVDVGYFAKVCGDKVCQAHEDYLSCPQDCPSPASAAAKEGTEKEKIGLIKSLWSEIVQYKWYILGGGLLLISVYLILKRRR